jgi:hypothetical protein
MRDEGPLPDLPLTGSSEDPNSSSSGPSRGAQGPSGESPMAHAYETAIQPLPSISQRCFLAFGAIGTLIGGGLLSANFFLHLRGEPVLCGTQTPLILLFIFLPIFLVWQTLKPAGIPFSLTVAGREAGIIHPDRYFIPFDSRLIVSLNLFRLACLAILVIDLAFYLEGISHPFAWVRHDALLALGAVSIYLWSTTCQYVIRPRAGLIEFRFWSPFYRDHRDFSFDEVVAVVSAGKSGGWPVGIPFQTLSLSTSLLFPDGKCLEVFPAESATDKPAWVMARNRERASLLADLLGRPEVSGPMSSHLSIEAWNSRLSEVVAPFEQRHLLRDRLWEMGLGSDALMASESGRVKLELATPLEKVFLFGVMLLMGITIIWFLVAELELLRNNPRFFYLLLLDGASIIATILALWRWLIDQHYVLDCRMRTLRFSSRILFFSWEKEIAAFNEIKDAFVARHTEGKSEEYEIVIRLKSGKDYGVSDRNLQAELMKYRLQAIRQIIGLDRPDRRELEKEPSTRIEYQKENES